MKKLDRERELGKRLLAMLKEAVCFVENNTTIEFKINGLIQEAEAHYARD